MDSTGVHFNLAGSQVLRCPKSGIPGTPLEYYSRYGISPEYRTVFRVWYSGYNMDSGFSGTQVPQVWYSGYTVATRPSITPRKKPPSAG